MRMDEWLERSQVQSSNPLETLRRKVRGADEVFTDTVGGWFGSLGRGLGRRALEQPIDETATVGSALHDAGLVSESALDNLYPQRPGEFRVPGAEAVGRRAGDSGSIFRDLFNTSMGVDQMIPASIAKFIDPDKGDDKASPFDFGRWTEAPSLTEATPDRLNYEWRKRTGHDAPWYLQGAATGLGFAGDVFFSPSFAFDVSSYSKASLHALRGPIGRRAAETAANAPEIAARVKNLGAYTDDIAEAGEDALRSFPDLSVRDLTNGYGIDNIRQHMIPKIRQKLGNTDEATEIASQYADTVIRNAQDLASRNLRTFVPLAVRHNHHLQRTLREIPERIRTPVTIEKKYRESVEEMIEALKDTPRIQAAMRSAEDFPFDEFMNSKPSDWSDELMERAKDITAREASLEDFADAINKDDTLLESAYAFFSAQRTAHMRAPGDSKLWDDAPLHRAAEQVVVSNKFERTQGHSDAQDILRGVSEEQKRAVYMMTQMNPFYIKESSFNDIARTLAGTIEEGDVPITAYRPRDLSIAPMDAGAEPSLVAPPEKTGAEELLKTFVGDLGENFDWKLFSPETESDELMNKGLNTEMERLFRMGQDRLEAGEFRDLPINSMYTDQDPVEVRQAWKAAERTRRLSDGTEVDTAKLGPDISFTVRERPDDETLHAMKGHIDEALDNMDSVDVEFVAPKSYGIPTVRRKISSTEDLDKVMSEVGITPFSMEQLSKKGKWLGVDTKDKVRYALAQSGELPPDKAKEDELLARILGEKKADSPPGFDIREVNLDEVPEGARTLLQVEDDMQRFFGRMKSNAQESIKELAELLGESPEDISGKIGDLGYGYWPQRSAMMRRVFKTASDKRRGHLQSFMRMAQHARPVEQLLISPVGQTPVSHNVGDAGQVMANYSQKVANIHLYKELVKFAKKYGVRTEFNMLSAASGWYPLSRIKPAGEVNVESVTAAEAAMSDTAGAVRDTLRAIREGDSDVASSDIANMLLKKGIDGADKDMLLPGVEDYLLPEGVSEFFSSHFGDSAPSVRRQAWRNAMSFPRRQALTTVPWLAANAIDQIYSFALAGPRTLDKYIAGAQTALAAYADDMMKNLQKSAPRTDFEQFKHMQNKRIAQFLESLAGGSKHDALRKQIMKELQQGGVGGEGWAQHMRHGRETAMSFMNPQQEEGALSSSAKWLAREIDGAHSLFVRMGGGMEDFARKMQYSAMRLEGVSQLDAQDALSKGFVNYNATALSSFDEWAKDAMYFWTYWKQRPEQLGSAMLSKPWTVWWPYKMQMAASDAFATEQEQILERGAPDYIQRQPDYARIPWDFGPLKMIKPDEQTKQDFIPWMRWRISPLETAGDIRDLTGIDDVVEGDASSAIYKLFSRSAPLFQAGADISRGEVMEGVKDMLPFVSLAQDLDQWMTPYSEATEKDINETRRIFRMPSVDTMPEQVGSGDEMGLDERLWELRHKKQFLENLGIIVHFENKGNLASHLGRDDFRELNELRREQGFEPLAPTSRQQSRWTYDTDRGAWAGSRTSMGE